MNSIKSIIYLQNFRENFKNVQNKIGKTAGICVSVKADAYGHGSVPIAKTALECGALYLAVSNINEGLQLRKAGIKAKILLFSQVVPDDIKDVSAINLVPFIADIETADLLSSTVPAGEKQEVHLKIDTGMGRFGCFIDEAVKVSQYITGKKNLVITGIATHLASSDSLQPNDVDYTKQQLEKFRIAVKEIKKTGIDPGIIHAANSGAVCFHNDSYFDMVRPGIFLYGYSPANDTTGGLHAKPVMELRSRLTFIKKILKGQSVSYGCTWCAPDDTYIGTIHAGYADGIPRALSNNFLVKIKNREYPVAGRICMDQFMVNLGAECKVKRWDEVVIFGPAPAIYDAAGIAKKTGTIPYEILCNINSRVPRVYL